MTTAGIGPFLDIAKDELSEGLATYRFVGF